MVDSSQYLSKVNVLVVDPSTFGRRLVINVLHAFGCNRYREATDGADALKVIKAGTPDIIFTELAMQPLDGIEMTRFIRQENELGRATIPIIMVSAHSRHAVVTEARDSGIHEFVVKPFSARSLIARVRETIERPRPFVRTSDFFGPDRRRRQVDGVRFDRRHENPVPASPAPVLHGTTDPLTQQQVDRLIAQSEVEEDHTLSDDLHHDDPAA